MAGYLVHSCFGLDDKGRVLNLAGDFPDVPTDLWNYPQDVQRGYELHRKIDSYTHNHPSFRASMGLVGSTRFQAVQHWATEIFFDHFLAFDWPRYYSHITLKLFAQNIYNAIRENSGALPRQLVSIVPQMEEENWLVSIGTKVGVGAALGRLADSIQKDSPDLIASLLGTTSDLERHHEPFCENFKKFFSELRSESLTWGSGMRL